MPSLGQASTRESKFCAEGQGHCGTLQPGLSRGNKASRHQESQEMDGAGQHLPCHVVPPGGCSGAWRPHVTVDPVTLVALPG